MNQADKTDSEGHELCDLQSHYISVFNKDKMAKVSALFYKTESLTSCGRATVNCGSGRNLP